MKFLGVAVSLIFFNLPAFAEAKRDCSRFFANFVGLEAALKECSPTPKFIAWVKEEKIRIESEESAKQEESKKVKAD